jgi:hypothetical protein
LASSETELAGFLEAAGRSFADAQGGLVGGGPGTPGAVAIAEAELEVKATLESAGAGSLSLRPVSGKDAREAGIEPGLLSTLRIRYVALPEEASSAGELPKRTPERVIAEVGRREDVVALDKILGGLELDATFLPVAASWLVQARDPQQRVVRTVLVPDAKG